MAGRDPDTRHVALGIGMKRPRGGGRARPRDAILLLAALSFLVQFGEPRVAGRRGLAVQPGEQFEPPPVQPTITSGVSPAVDVQHIVRDRDVGAGRLASETRPSRAHGSRCNGTRAIGTQAGTQAGVNVTAIWLVLLWRAASLPLRVSSA